MSELKFGVSYNVFDGVELLEDSIIQIRDLVDYVTVIYQEKSNWGNIAPEIQLPILTSLLDRGIIDKLQLYVCDGKNKNKKVYETEKRNIGLNLSRKNGCTHHMSMDCDEFYFKDEFKKYIEWVHINPTKVAYVNYIDYIKHPSIRNGKSPLVCSGNHVPLFAPILNKSKFVFNFNLPILSDPSRKINNINYEELSVELIVMHHMTMIRLDIRSKIENASKKVNWTSDKVEEVLKKYNNLDINSEDSIKKYSERLYKTKPLFELENFNKLVKGIDPNMKLKK